MKNDFNGCFNTFEGGKGLVYQRFNCGRQLEDAISLAMGYGPPCARARGPALVLGYRGRSNRQGFSPHGEVKMI